VTWSKPGTRTLDRAEFKNYGFDTKKMIENVVNNAFSKKMIFLFKIDFFIVLMC